MMNQLEPELERALRFYEGDVCEEEKEDTFWGDEKAYSTINALLFDGIVNERMKALEKRPLNPAFLERSEETIMLCSRLLKACHICAEQNSGMEAYRVERLSNYRDCVKAGRTVAFTSASANGFLKEYQDKIGLVLMRFQIPEKTPCVVFSKVMPNYKKAQEAEILLPPFLKLSFEETELTKEEAKITDANRETPKVSCIVRVENIGSLQIEELKNAVNVQSVNDIELANMQEKKRWNKLVTQDNEENAVLNLYWQEGIEAGKRVFTALKYKKEPKEEDIAVYSCWKKELKRGIMAEFMKQIQKA